MSTARTTDTADGLLAAVQRLPADQLREFDRRFQAWRDQRVVTAEEARLIARVEECSHLSAEKQARYEILRARCDEGRLTPGELGEYQRLLEELEARNVQRVEALAALAERRGVTLSALVAELGRGVDGND